MPTDILKSIDWTQVGPFTALLLVCAILGLCLAPFAFRYLGKRVDVDADRQKRLDEQDILKDTALLGFVKTTSDAVQQIGIAMKSIEPIIRASEQRLAGKIDVSKNEIKVEIVALRNEIDDKKQVLIQKELNALKNRPSKP